jgi:hypothetical protein
MYVGGQALPTNIHFFVTFRISEIHNVLDVKVIFLKLWIFTNLNTVFPVLVLVFDFKEFSEWVLHGHYTNGIILRSHRIRSKEEVQLRIISITMSTRQII